MIKWVQNRGREDLNSVGALNYLVGLAASTPFFLGLCSYPGLESQMDINHSWWVAVACGSTMGASYFTAYFFVSYCIAKVGVPATAVVGALSILLPIACGILIWGERPAAIQYLGMALAMGALVLVALGPSLIPSRNSRLADGPGDGGRSVPRHKPRPAFFSVATLVLAGFYLLAGTNRLAQEAFKYESEAGYLPTYLFFAFLCSSIPSAVLLISKQRLPTRMELAFGTAMGLANFLQSFGVLAALQSFDGYIVYPAISAGSLIVTSLVASLFLGDTLDRWTAFGVILAVLALVLLRAF